MDIEGEIKLQGEIDETGKDLPLQCSLRIILHYPVVQAHLADGDEVFPLPSDKGNHGLGLLEVKAGRVEPCCRSKERMACGKVQVPFPVREILADGDDRGYPDCLRPLDDLGPISIKQGIAEVGVGIYEAVAAHGERLESFACTAPPRDELFGRRASVEAPEPQC